MPRRKEAIRSYIKNRLTNDEWTLLQAEVYGPRVLEAKPFPGALEFLASCRSCAARPRIISHKGQYPAAAKKYDLHECALLWLRENGFFSQDVGLSEDDVTFAPSRVGKVEQIRLHACDVFIDDLPEVFAERTFPETVRKILFDPHERWPSWRDGFRATSWDDVRRNVLADAS